MLGMEKLASTLGPSQLASWIVCENFGQNLIGWALLLQGLSIYYKCQYILMRFYGVAKSISGFTNQVTA